MDIRKADGGCVFKSSSKYDCSIVLFSAFMGYFSCTREPWFYVALVAELWHFKVILQLFIRFGKNIENWYYSSAGSSQNET